MYISDNAASKSIDVFLKKIIDYAGLFPPARLSLETAFGNYVHYLKSENNFMLSRFICPVKLFSELARIISSNYPDEKGILISVLGRGGYNEEDFFKNLQEDLILWKNLLSSSGSIIKADSFEIKLPDEIITSHDTGKIAGFINTVSDEINKNIPVESFIFFEGHIGTEWKKNIKHFIEGIKMHNLTSNNSGYKLRTGGVEAYSFPAPGQIAYSIRECLDRNIPMKCTAGLHHPFRHFDTVIGTMMHGFINVFGAGIIAMRHNISDEEMIKIISDENPDNFSFNEKYFAWNDWKINADEIGLARKNLMLSFGSCSFDEPEEDLKKLKLL